MLRHMQNSLVLILGLLTALGPLSIDMYLPAFQAMGQDLGVPMVMIQQTLSVYFLGMAFGQLIYGPLSDRLGRKPPLFVGLTLYVISSLGCMLAPGIYSLVALRLLQALGGCAGIVMARAVVRDYFPPREMARMMSLLMLVMGLAPVFAPAAGGLLVKIMSVSLGWRAIFGVLTALGIAALLMVLFLLPESLPPEKRLQKLSPGRVLTTYFHLLKDWRFLSPTLAGGLALGCLFTYISASSAIFVDFFKLSPVQYSVLFAFNAVGIIGGAQVNRFLLKTRTPEAVMSRALTLSMIGGLIFWGLLVVIPAQLFLTAVCLWLVLAILGFVMPNSAAIALAEQKDNAGAASSMMGVLQYALGALSSATVAWVLKAMNGEPLALVSVMITTLILARLSSSKNRVSAAAPIAHTP